MNDTEAKAYLTTNYGQPVKSTKKLDIFVNSKGMELALAVGTTSRATIYAANVPAVADIKVPLEIYAADDSSRHSNLNATNSLGVGHSISKFTIYEQSELTELCELYDSLASEQESFATYVEHMLSKATEDPSKWFEGYKETYEMAMTRPGDDDTLHRLWQQRDNHVSGLPQGKPSGAEFLESKDAFREMTVRIVESPSEETYQYVLSRLQGLKEQGKLRHLPKATANRVFAAVAPDLVTSTVNEQSFLKVAKYLSSRFKLNLHLDGSWFQNNLELKQALERLGSKDIHPIKVNFAIWIQFDELEKNQNNRPSGKVSESNAKEYKMKSASPLNQILYGPPGTGKTFHTIEAAVMAADPSFASSTREELKAEYDRLIGEGRIQFVTFHHSFGYEEFVEGLKATSENGDVSYEVASGIFKNICRSASLSNTKSVKEINTALESFNAEIEELDLITLYTSRGKAFDVTYLGKSTFRVFPKESLQEDLKNGYPVSIENIVRLYVDESAKGIYNPSYAKAILAYLRSNHGLTESIGFNAVTKENFVLVIDEINRGNISKIFGELITLIEDSKRSGEGNSESLKLTLPYSGDIFSVPDNLYIIGTMNTADRSLAMMDTALRRRFDFKEMMPDASHFNETNVKGINLGQLLTKLNQRIEALYDREHTLGHAFFFPVKEVLETQGEDAAFNKLKSVFENKILPLLEEYFFEDWHKIRLVLGDNQKTKQNEFVKEVSVSFTDLFGSNSGLDDGYFSQEDAQNKRFEVASFKDEDSSWNNPAAYRGIYQGQQVTDSEV